MLYWYSVIKRKSGIDLNSQCVLPKLSGILEFVWDPFSTPQARVVLFALACFNKCIDLFPRFWIVLSLLSFHLYILPWWSNCPRRSVLLRLSGSCSRTTPLCRPTVTPPRCAICFVLCLFFFLSLFFGFLLLFLLFRSEANSCRHSSLLYCRDLFLLRTRISTCRHFPARL